MGASRRNTALAGVLAVGLLWPAALVQGAPRHQFAWGEADDPAAVSGWVELGDGRAGNGQNARVAPQTAPSRPPGGAPVGPPAGFEAPTDPYVPPVEPPDAGAGSQLPDLAPLPAWGVYVDDSIVEVPVGDIVLGRVRGEDPYAGRRRSLRFGATIANRGRHSLEILGVPEPSGNPEDPVRVQALQCTRFAGARVAGAERACQTYTPVGSLVFHAQHGHLHIDGFAQYRLLRDAAGRPDTSARGVLARSEKVGFCMADTDWLGRGQMVVDTGWYRECRHTTPHVPATFRQGVSPQWGDSYGPNLPGQHLVIDKLGVGFYWIEITVNPANTPGAVKILETNRANNTSYRRVELRHTSDGYYVREL